MAKIDKDKLKKDAAKKVSKPIEAVKKTKEKTKKIDKEKSKSTSTKSSGFKLWWNTNWRKRWFKVTVITSVVLSLFLIIFLPILFLVILKDDKTRCKFTINGDKVNVCNADDASVKSKQIDKYNDKAILWAFKEQSAILTSLGIVNADKAYDEVEEAVATQIANEIDGYKADHGSGWSAVWDDDLLAKGFDTQEEYKESLLSSRLNQYYLAKGFKFSATRYKDTNDLVAKNQGINGAGDDAAVLKELAKVSSIPDGADYTQSGGSITTLNPSIVKNIDFANGIVGGANGISPFDMFIRDYKPMATSQILFGWTWKNTTSANASPDNVTGDGITIETDAIEKLLRFGIVMNDANSNPGGYVPFSTLATSYSTDGSASNGGNLGIISGINTGYINEYNNAMFTALSGSATLGKLNNYQDGFWNPIAKNLNQFKSLFNSTGGYVSDINNAMNNTDGLKDLWGGSVPGSDWSTLNDGVAIKNFFANTTIDGSAKEALERNLFSEFDDSVKFNRSTVDNYQMNTSNYFLADSDQETGKTNIQDRKAEDIPYMVVPSRFGLHVIRIEQLRGSEMYQGEPDSTIISNLAYDQETNILNELGFRMLRNDMTQINNGKSDKQSYNLSSQFNSYITNELPNLMWDWAYSDPSFLSFEGVDQKELDEMQNAKDADKFANEITDITNLTSGIGKFYEENKFMDGGTPKPAFDLAQNNADKLTDWMISFSNEILELGITPPVPPVKPLADNEGGGNNV